MKGYCIWSRLQYILYYSQYIVGTYCCRFYNPFGRKEKNGKFMKWRKKSKRIAINCCQWCKWWFIIDWRSFNVKKWNICAVTFYNRIYNFRWKRSRCLVLVDMRRIFIAYSFHRWNSIFNKSSFTNMNYADEPNERCFAPFCCWRHGKSHKNKNRSFMRTRESNGISYGGKGEKFMRAKCCKNINCVQKRIQSGTK